MTDADPYQSLVRVKPSGQGIERVKREPLRHLYQHLSDSHRRPLVEHRGPARYPR